MNKIVKWADDRLKFIDFYNNHAGQYWAPKNFNFWYYFGVLSMVVMVIQILSGMFLTMFYKPDAKLAFESVEYIMRDVNYGWLIRYLHSTGASAFFLVVYLHMTRAMLYGSYKAPREMVWIIGTIIFMILMAEAFLGYLLPWGQMSYWGATVITSLFDAIPVIGSSLAQWIRGDYTISDVTLTRFFAIHVAIIPMIFVGIVVMHIHSLHIVGSNNPDGIDIKQNKDKNGNPVDGIRFSPYYVTKDLVGIGIFLSLFFGAVFFFPEGNGYFIEPPNFVPANPLETPEHIAPVWYMTPFYSILRAVPDKFGGVLAMVFALLIIFFLPWLDKSPIRSIRYRSNMYKVILFTFFASFLILGYLGTLPPTEIRTLIARLCTFIYFAFFLLMPFYTRNEKGKELPSRLT